SARGGARSGTAGRDRARRLCAARGAGALKAVRATLDVGASVPRVRARAHLLEQALVNLVLNAVDAAPGAAVVLGTRRWACAPGRAGPRRASDQGLASLARRPARRPGRGARSAGRAG